MSPVALMIVKRLINISLVSYFRRYAVPVIASLGMAAAVSGIKYAIADRLGDPAVLGICIVVGVGVYSLIIVVLARSLAERAWEFLRLALSSESTEAT